MGTKRESALFRQEKDALSCFRCSPFPASPYMRSSSCCPLLTASYRSTTILAAAVRLPAVTSAK